MRKLLIATPLVVLIPLLGGCASASATGRAADQPGLVIPPPPPHVVPITTEPVLEPVGEIPTPTTAGTPSARANRGTRDPQPRPSGTDSRTEPKPGETTATPPPVAEPPPPPAPTVPPPQLRPVESAGSEGAVRSSIDRARQILATVDYRKLPALRRKAYDDAKKFADQADEALKQGNVVFALGVAGKAETLAKELARQ